MNRPIYLDHHATTPVDPRVVAAMAHAMTVAFGNPRSADHTYGDEARDLVESARCNVARLLDCEPRDVRFTSGASQSVRLAVEHVCRATDREHGRPARIAATTVEHRAVFAALEKVEREKRAEVSLIKVDRRGQLDERSLRAALERSPDLVCVIAANNEIGTVVPIDAIAHAAENAGSRVLVDATQAVGKIAISVRASPVSYLALSGHKLYGPKGIGALVITGDGERGDDFEGTPNVPGIVGLGEACRLRQAEMADDEDRVARLRDRLQRLLLASEPAIVVNGDTERRLSGSLHISVPGVPNDAVVANLRDRVALSTGAACASGAEAPSHVLDAIGLSDDLRDGALRLCLGKFTTQDDVDAAAAALIETIRGVRARLA